MITTKLKKRINREPKRKCRPIFRSGIATSSRRSLKRQITATRRQEEKRDVTREGGISRAAWFMICDRSVVSVHQWTRRQFTASRLCRSSAGVTAAAAAGLTSASTSRLLAPDPTFQRSAASGFTGFRKMTKFKKVNNVCLENNRCFPYLLSLFCASPFCLTQELIV